jgi:hypothetical protein
MSSTGNGKSDLLFNFIFLRIVDFSFHFFDHFRPKVLDVMSPVNSSPPSEARSPPPARRTTFPKRSYISDLAVTMTVQVCDTSIPYI